MPWDVAAQHPCRGSRIRGEEAGWASAAQALPAALPKEPHPGVQPEQRGGGLSATAGRGEAERGPLPTSLTSPQLIRALGRAAPLFWEQPLGNQHHWGAGAPSFS